MIARKPLKQVSGKPKQCAVRECRAPFVPKAPFQKFCSADCGLILARQAQEKARAAKAKLERQAHREAKEKIKSRGDHLKEAQSAFNEWVRLRDASQPCISCGRYHSGKYDAGHYRTVGGNPALRFEPLNCHKQCVPCNQHKSGNVIEYRINLVKRIGKDKVEWLEGPHEPKHYSIDQIKTIKARYRALVRELKRGRG